MKEESKRAPESAGETIADGGPLSVPGVRGAAVETGVKPSGEPDLAVVDAGREMSAAGVFTRNRLPAAPVLLCRNRLRDRPAARCIVINSGNANAMTGERGEADARAMAERLERSCAAPALVLSTGVIGVPLPLESVLDGIDRACKGLETGAGEQVARAMMTTDTRPKRAALRFDISAGSERPARSFTVGGVAKGSGMIHPDMATMLALVVTDAPLGPDATREVLRAAVDRSFNSITVDGDTSTNDTVLLLAGDSGEEPLAGRDRQRAAAAIEEVMRRLARQILLDGEGVERIAEIRVHGAADDEQARRVAAKIACSSLVKTALAGGDPNWGRILAAAANAGVELEPGELVLTLGGHEVFGGGGPRQVDQRALDETFARSEIEIDLSIGAGPGRAEMSTGDLTKRYVEINSEYTT
ncbi:MAG: bifunctional glutamate N-acetyltransferase/amino-acid acetyltransferase ArgJ [Polyangia bacterium]